MAKLTKAQQAAIGRRSRRKGASFECMLAKKFREWFGGNWQTSRNSGRTDIPGDVYCVDRPCRVLVECKHRKSMSVGDIIKGNKAYLAELHKVFDHWLRQSDYPILLVFRKDEYGIWVLIDADEDRGPRPEAWNLFKWMVEITDTEGNIWRLVTGVSENAGVRESVFEDS